MVLWLPPWPHFLGGGRAGSQCWPRPICAEPPGGGKKVRAAGGLDVARGQENWRLTVVIGKHRLAAVGWDGLGWLATWRCRMGGKDCRTA